MIHASFGELLNIYQRNKKFKGVPLTVADLGGFHWFTWNPLSKKMVNESQI